MEKELFVGEYPFRASKKMLYPYLSTASGLAQWFADDVNISNKLFTFVWDGEQSTAKLVGSRLNAFARFEFVDEEAPEDPNYVEFKLDMNELTQEVFLRISDYSDIEKEELEELYESLVHDLKEIVGG